MNYRRKKVARNWAIACFCTALSLSAFAQSYREEEVTFRNGETVLSGTLSFPAAASKRYKAIVLVSGSGPQNRDSELVGFKPFKLLADAFNGHGYAVLRYDDRGVGKSTGKSTNESTTQDLAEDARQAYLFLRSRSDIDSRHVGMLGHSEGGAVVPLVASKEPVSFVILLAGYGVRGIDLSNAQQAAILRSSGMSDEFIAASGKMNSTLLEKIASDTVSEERIKAYVITETKKLLPLLPEAVRSQITDPDAYASMVSKQVLAQMRSPWIRYYMTYDPGPALSKVKCPVLMLFGERDTQVLPSQNLEVMKNILAKAGNNHVEAKVIPQANHLFQEAVTGSPSEYASLKKEFAPSLLSELTQWLDRLK